VQAQKLSRLDLVPSGFLKHQLNERPLHFLNHEGVEIAAFRIPDFSDKRPEAYFNKLGEAQHRRREGRFFG